MEGGSINQGFQRTSDGYQIYTGRQSVSITQLPVPFEDYPGREHVSITHTSDGYQIYTGRESTPITQPPVPLEDNSIVMPKEFLSQTLGRNNSTGIPTDEIELQGFARMSQTESVQEVKMRNARDDAERRQHMSYYSRSVHVNAHGMGNDFEESENSSTVALKSESDIFKQGKGITLTVFKLITVIVTVWDMASDWALVTKFDDQTCYRNMKYNQIFLTDRCGWDREKILQVIAVFSMIGSIFGVIQIINIILEILHNWGLTTFRLCHAQYDLCISLYCEEIPQAIILIIFNYSCTCELQGRFLSLLAIISGFVSCAFRYASSFRSVGGDTGCCNIWWRCCCCRQQQFLCHCDSQECCCECNIPCPVFCCTLSCDNCQWTTHTWCAGWMKMLSCFCSCCSEDHSMFGVRIMNNLGLVCLFCCFISMGTLWGIAPHLS